MGGLRRRRAEEAEEEAVGALMVAQPFAIISIGVIKMPVKPVKVE